MIFRTDEQKRDLKGGWNRPDRPFFATGACHILAAAFLETYPCAGYAPIFVKPNGNFRGGHVLVANAEIVFDYHGYTERMFYFDHFAIKMGRFFPRWSAQALPLLESPAAWDFCRQTNHRHPSQFIKDPFPRAFAYLQRFPAPQAAVPKGCKVCSPNF
jgi:hypothetical protein